MIRGEMLNRLFGGKCGFTALAIMNMLPMPMDQIKGFDSHRNVEHLEKQFLDFVMDDTDYLKLKKDTSDCEESEKECDDYETDNK